MRRSVLISGVVGALLTFVSLGNAQEEGARRQEMTVHGTGFFTKDSQG